MELLDSFKNTNEAVEEARTSTGDQNEDTTISGEIGPDGDTNTNAQHNEQHNEHNEHNQHRNDNDSNNDNNDSINDNKDSINDTDDDYDISDAEAADLDSHNSWFATNLSDHSKYLNNVLNNALDLVDLDKSLVLQTKLSGNLNNENQKVIDKKQLLLEKLSTLQALYKQNFVSSSGPSKIDQLKLDIHILERRLAILKHEPKPTLFSVMKSKNRQSITERFPIEYNQARDKVLERQLDD